MRKIEIEERKLIQLEILDVVHEFCERNGIKYSIAYGTLIGAVRHKGYIPWDDDIDIVMLREDYDKFVATFDLEHYEIASFETKKLYLPFVKVCDNRTIIIDRKANTQGLGINIDIFPIDTVPNSNTATELLCRRIKIVSAFNRVKLYKINNFSSVKNRILGALFKIILLPFPNNYFIKRILSLEIKYRYSSSGKVMCIGDSAALKPLDEYIYKELDMVSFEGNKYWGMKNYDTYLSALYGDYMQLPPEEKRISYHTSDAYWK